MHFTHTIFLRLLTAGLAAVILMGCQSVQPTLLATVSVDKLATQAPENLVQPGGGYPSPAQGYPTGGEPASVPTVANYPAPGEGTGPASGVPAVDNRAKVTGTLVETAPDPNSASITRLHVKVLTVADVEGMPNFAKDLANQEEDLFIETAKLPGLHPNDRFEALVSYQGDENSGRFVVLEMNKLE